MTDHINPNHEIDGELLSAYLDGELTASEHVVVEQAIENSPPLRESLQELNVLSKEIQSLSVAFHFNEQEMIDTVITKVRDRNLSVHGQAPYCDVKMPVMDKSWKQRLQIPALLALTACVLAVLTLQFMPNESSMTLVQTDLVDATPPLENFQRAENDALEPESVSGNGPPMGAMGGGVDLAGESELPRNQESHDNATRLAMRPSAANDRSFVPAQILARSFPGEGDIANSTDQPLDHRQVDKKTAVADVTYHIKVKEKDLPKLLGLLTAHQNLAQNIERKKAVELADVEKNAAEEQRRRVALGKSMENNVQKSTVNQIVMFRSNANQLVVLVDALQKNPAFALSMNHLQRGALENGRMAKNKEAPSVEVNDQGATTVLSDTIFSIQVIVTP
ncbi:MAG: zf-HC2 domain-containing protein [Planctomycetaceae bacterium]|jgi:hypothetical protein|nr:zf-HC2 domain-containing protein [Planctomycetaceae bacterium]